GQQGWAWLTFEDGLAAAIEYGVARESVYSSTFKKQQFEGGTSYAARRDAQRHRIEQFNTSTGEQSHWELTRSDRVREWKTTLDQGWPVLMGMHVTEDYRRLAHDHPDPLPAARLPGDGDVLSEARHAAAVLGYAEDDATDGAFLVSDSRGANFGDAGRWWLPYELVRTAFVIEAWTVRFITYGYDD
ncbi:hypothetical protein LCGC14_2744580, partial [marine sediment metagenome]